MNVYEYRATIVRVIDGDTVAAIVDLGFHVSMEMRLRLAGINAPEMRGEEKQKGQEAKSYLEATLDFVTGGTGKVTIHTRKDSADKYGRYLATIFVGRTNLNERMIEAGHAVIENYD